MHPIVVGLSDEHEVFRRGVQACLEDDPLVEVIYLDGPAGAPAEIDVAVVSDTVARGRPLPGPMIVCHGPDVSGLDNLDNVFAVLPRATVTPAQVLSAVRAAAAGLRIDSRPAGATGLDDRSLDVLRLLAAGADTGEISATLGYSQRTIKSVIAKAQADLGARSRAHAVAEAIRGNLI